jgi:predicted ATPase
MLLAISQRGVRLLVETHSEHLLLRLRRRIAESRLNPLGKSVLDPHDVVIYFIEQLGVQSHVYQVLPNELGAFIDPPERFRSFFSDDYEETIEWSRVAAQIAQEAGSERGG